jgi:hypothetical protein
MNILIACERSGRVRDAFRARGHNAYSCDVEPCDVDGAGHLRGDVRPLLDLPWDIVIAFPPCTYLSKACSWRWPRTELEIRKAAGLVALLASAGAVSCIENPPGWLNTHWRRPTQTVQPYLFGDSWSKQTCLWLRGLPELVPTNIVEQGASLVASISSDSRQCSRRRSLTSLGLAAAMASQWG